MGTEARRAGIPPRPSSPPRPPVPPGEDFTADDTQPPGNPPPGTQPNDTPAPPAGQRSSREPSAPPLPASRPDVPRRPGLAPPPASATGNAPARPPYAPSTAPRSSQRAPEQRPPAPSSRGAASTPPRPGTPPATGATGSRPPGGEGGPETGGFFRRPAPASAAGPRRTDERPKLPLHPDRGTTPPPPPASARFPDTPPSGTAQQTTDAGRRDFGRNSTPTRPSAPPRRTDGPAESFARQARPAAPPRPTGVPAESFARQARPAAPPQPTGVPAESFSETTTRLRPIRDEESGAGAAPSPEVPSARRPADAVSPSGTTTEGRPFVSFGQPENPGIYDDTARPPGGRTRPRIVAATVCVVLGLGLIGGAATGSWLTGDSASAAGAAGAFAASGNLWHSVPVDQLFPPTVNGEGAGPGGADRTWTRIAVASDSGCTAAFDPLLRKALAPVGCLRLLRATYTDATRSHVTTVGLLFTKADAAAMTSLKTRFQKDGLDRRTDLMPRGYAAKGTVAAGFGDAQRASWTVSVLTDAPVVVYAVSGFADGRSVTTPEPAADAVKSGATSSVAQAGLGHEAQGLADRIERSLRKTVTSATEKPS
ncbi:hypothetical protein ACFVYF_22655 [Streptomyces sp. NPDC058274]|uniref:hypothetical protein n=1 Tax=Streptomyces sp. NPDC058274 TaxID=3346416 RepID=UPI0036EA9CE5